MTHAELGFAEEKSGKLVTLARQQARVIAEREQSDYIIIDGPPGIGCPVIAAITGVDLLLIVTEPTLSGIHDLERVIGVARHFDVPALVCINKYDINLNNSKKIEEYCTQNKLQIAGKIRYNPAVTKAMINKKSVVEYDCGEVTREIKGIWVDVMKALNNK